MNIAVFGGAGFLGIYIVNELLKRGHTVASFDVQHTKELPQNIQHQADILNVKTLEKIFSQQQFDAIYNLAGFANIDKASDAPKTTIELNIIGNLNLLEACKNQNNIHFIFASSAYAMNDKGSFYGISKLASEKIIKEYHQKYQLSYTILRFGSVYGALYSENNYIYNLVSEALSTKTINHEGNGEEIREYIHAADAARLAVDVIENDEFKQQYLLLTGMERLKRIELFNIIKEILGEEITIHLHDTGYKNHYQYTPYSFSAEHSKKLIPNPYIDMGQGIVNCVKSILERQNTKNDNNE